MSSIKIGFIFLDFASLTQLCWQQFHRCVFTTYSCLFSKEQNAKRVKGSTVATGLGEKFFLKFPHSQMLI